MSERDVCERLEGVRLDGMNELCDEAAAEIRTVRAERDALRSEVARLRPPEGSPGVTHWSDCWLTRGHHECAIARAEEARNDEMVERVRADGAEVQNEALHAEVARLKRSLAMLGEASEGSGIKVVHGEWWGTEDRPQFYAEGYVPARRDGVRGGAVLLIPGEPEVHETPHSEQPEPAS